MHPLNALSSIVVKRERFPNVTWVSEKQPEKEPLCIVITDEGRSICTSEVQLLNKFSSNDFNDLF